MGIRMIMIAIMAVILLAWVIFCAVQFVRSGKKIAAKLNVIGHVRCESCGTVYDVPASLLSKMGFVKSKTVSRTKFKSGAFVNEIKYLSYAKKFDCPCCQKKRYAQVLNQNEIQDKLRKPMLTSGIRWLIMMAVGGLLIISVARIPLSLAERRAEKEIEALQEQRYEDWKERYGFSEK